MLYTAEQLSRWKAAQEQILPFMQRDLGRYAPGSRVPSKLARHLEADAAIALADGDGAAALGYFHAASLNREIMWSDWLNGNSDRDTMETMQQAGCGPIVLSAIVGLDRAIESANLFRQVSPTLKFDDGIKELGEFLCQLVHGDSPTDYTPTGEADKHLGQIAIAFSSRDFERLQSAILEGADDWAAYVRSDPGWSNSVCYQIGAAFVRLAREMCQPDFIVDHALLPRCLFTENLDRTVGQHLVVRGG